MQSEILSSALQFKNPYFPSISTYNITKSPIQPKYRSSMASKSPATLT